MTLFRVYIAMSLDGYIAAPDGGVGWLEAFPMDEFDFSGFSQSIAVTVMGRRTYDESIGRGAFPRGGRTVVMTHRPIQDPPKGVVSFSGNVTELAARLRAEIAQHGRTLPEKKRDVWLIGGGQSIQAFHEAGLVDRWEIFIAPVLLGDGIPLFPASRSGLHGLRLTRVHRNEKSGFVEVWYEP